LAIWPSKPLYRLGRRISAWPIKGLKGIARRSTLGMVQFVAGQTFFSRSRRVRSVAYDVLSKRQRLVLRAPKDGEAFVVHSGDQWIGRGLFADGEFDFEKFVAALDILSKYRDRAPPKVLVDVGANVGSICIPAVARSLVERAVAIEPDPGHLRLLRANIALNGLEGAIRVVGHAAGPRDGELLELERDMENLGDHRIRVTHAPGLQNETDRAVVQVPSSRLDTVCQEEQDEDLLIWMDVQGFEGFVLEGSHSFLARRVPMVLEFCPYLLERAGSFSLMLTNLAGYDGFIDLNNPRKLRPIAELNELYRELGGSRAYSDIYTDILIL